MTNGVVRRARGLWAQLDPENVAGSWRAGVGKRMSGLVSVGQAIAAGRADGYLDEILDELGIDTTARAKVEPTAFAGVASDGRSLDTLLLEPVIRVKAAVLAKSPSPIASGEASLVRIVTTQLHDAARAAVTAGMTARPKVTGYVRMLNEPACGGTVRGARR